MSRISSSQFFIVFLLLSVAWMGMPKVANAKVCADKLYDVGCVADECKQRCSAKYPNDSSSQCLSLPPIPFHNACLCFYNCA
ncbi:hypothetical protein Csa_008032 [Cucumis sativus]|uniref:Uncharacterized protein n=1 Tax=Cucumis sativus TaxID=3659 RepID=A0A0A0KS76_CUCSA|nr:hypothetical protein Csa_008032 [Cucumis sativus]